MSLGTRLLDQPRSFRARGWLFQIHLWVGLAIGLYAVAIGLSGSVLMFHEELLDRSVHGAARVPPAGTPRPVEDWVATVRQVTGHKGGVHLQMPDTPVDAVRAVVYGPAGMQTVMLDPYTGSVLRHYRHRGTPLQLIEQFHSNFFLGRTGRVLNGVGGLLLLLLAITGLLLWWPGRRGWRRLSWIDFSASWKRINWDLHHAVGLWAWLGFVLLSFTGIYFTWPQTFRSTVAAVFPLSPPRTPIRLTPREQRLPLAELLRLADASVPGERIMGMEVPGNPREPVRVVKHGPGTRRFRTQTNVLVDPYRGEVIRVESIKSRTTGDTLLNWVPALHVGSFGGLAVKIVYAMLGLVFPLLFLTGFVMWWLRVVRKQLANYELARESTSASASSRV